MPKILVNASNSFFYLCELFLRVAPCPLSTCVENWKLTLSFDVLLVLLLLLLGFSLSGLDAVFPHGHRPVDPVQFEVEAAGITDRLPVVVPPPERGLGGVTVGAAQPVSPGGRGEHLRHRHRLEVHLKLCSI